MVPYKIVIRNLKNEIPEIHYIHAENTRDAKRKSIQFFRPEILVRNVEYIRMTEFLVREECGIFED